MSSIHDLADEITTLAAHISAATCRFLLLLAEFDERGGWAEEGCRTCSAWVSWKCSMQPNAAREHMRVARRLPDLPLVRAAFARGELTYSKVRAITRVEDIEDEAGLVELARHATALQLERLVRGYRRVLTVEQGDCRRPDRSVSWSYDDEGGLVLRARLPADEGALVVAALEAARDRVSAPMAVPAEIGDAPNAGATGALRLAAEDAAADAAKARNADALLALAEASLDETAAGGSSADRYQVVVHIDAAALDGSLSDGAGRAELDSGVPLSRDVARRLACDASLVRVIEQDGRPLTVGRKTRSIPPAVRRALRARDGGCAFPGCTNRRHVDAHHIEHWARGGGTDLDNLVHLCRHHHRLVHEGGFRIERRAGQLAFYSPNGRRLTPGPAVRRGSCPDLLATHGRAGLRVSAETPTPLSREPLDPSYGVDAMLAFAPPRLE